MPEKPKKHPKPESKTVLEPTVEMEETSHDYYTGNRGNSGNNNVLQCDAPGKECCIIQSKTGNVYLEAAGQLQSECKFRIEDVKGDKVLYTQSYTMNNTGVVDTFVDGNTTYNANADFTLNVVGTHTENVNVQAINAQSQTVKVSGAQEISVVTDRTIKVGGKVLEEIGGDKIRDVSGASKCTILGDTINNFLGKFEWIKASSERGVTISDKEQINISGEVSLNVGASEKVNIGVMTEQNLAKKHTTTLAHNTELTFGVKKENAAALVKKVEGLKAAYETKLKDDKATMGKFKYSMAKVSAKLMVYG
jgi:hypothetical protein